MAKILIIDDEKGVCEEFSAILREERHEADTALSASEGFEKIKKTKYDLIFLDVLMPKIEGREALEEIKKIAPGMPVVIMSGYLPPYQEKEILRSGAIASLKKPFDLKHVFQVIENALQKEKT